MKLIRIIIGIGVAILSGLTIAAIIISLITGVELAPPALEQMDRNINEDFADVLNENLGSGGGYQFGDPKHTISYAIGKKLKDGTLSPKGKAVEMFLDRIQPWHTVFSVAHEENRCDSDCRRPYKDHF